MANMVKALVSILTNSCNRLMWILIVLVTLPVGPYPQVISIHSQQNQHHQQEEPQYSSSHPHRQWSTRVVEIPKQGHIRGFLFLPKGHEGVEVFLGIPYAEPPLGSLRFMPPQEYNKPFSGVIQNEQFPPVCPQVLPWGLTFPINNGSAASANQTASEDEEALKFMPRGRLAYLKRLIPYLSDQSENCLFLNIYVPLSVADGREKRLLPVLVVFILEAFGFGTANAYDPSMLCSEGRVIVVTVNHRLGILGFLNANSDGYFKSPANFALLDQIAALHWVQENIGKFGGDKGNVTLMGVSKGASLINFMILSNTLPKELLFHRVILISGSALSPVSLSNGNLAKKFAARLKCPTEIPSNMRECLKKIPLQYFLQSELWGLFGPSDDGVVIEHGIRENILRDKLSRYPMLIGVTRAELLPTLAENDAVYGLETEKRREVLKQLVDGLYGFNRGEILAAALQATVHEYTDWERPVQHPISVRDETLDALADAHVVSPLVKLAGLHSTGNSQTYFYVFEYQSKISDYTQRLGCVPGEDLNYIFGVPLYYSWNDFIIQQQQQLSSSSGSSSGGGGEQQQHHQNWSNRVASSSSTSAEAELEKLGFFIGNFTKQEVQLSFTLVHYWANFIRTGNPTAEQTQEGHGYGGGGSENSKGGSTEMMVNSGGNSRTPQLHQQQFAKPKLVDWPPYDTLFQKYLSIESKPRVRSHYRSHRISFWNFLVPELIRIGYNNNGYGTLGTTGGLSSSNNNNHNLPFNESFMYNNSRNPSTIELVGPWEQRQYFYIEYNSSYPGDIPGPLLYTPGRHPYYHDHHHNGDGQNYQLYSTALTVTIAVGCSLLILNILVFAAFYYYRDKRRNNSGSIRGRREASDGSYGQHQQHLLHQHQQQQQQTSLIGRNTSGSDIGGCGGGPDGSVNTTIDHLQMQEISAAVAAAASVGQTHNHPGNFAESSTITRQLLAAFPPSSTAGDNPIFNNNPSVTSSTHPSQQQSMPQSSLQNTPVRFPQHHLKENGQILNLRHHLQQQQQPPPMQMPTMLPMPNICGDLTSVQNLQQLLQQNQKQEQQQLQQNPSSHHNIQPHQDPQQHQYLQYQQQQQQHPHHISSSTLPSTGQLPRKHQKGASNVNLANLDFSTMPDAILAAAMMLNYRQQQQQPPTSSSSSAASSTTVRVSDPSSIHGTILRSSSSQKSTTAPRKSLNMKEQLLISAGIIGSGGGGSGPSVNLVGIGGGGTLGRTGGTVGMMSAGGSPNLGGSIIGTSTGGGAPPPHVIQYGLVEASNNSSINGKNVPKPPKRHTPTVKFSPETFTNGSGVCLGGSSGNGNASPDSGTSSAMSSNGGGSVINPGCSVSGVSGANVVSSTVAAFQSQNPIHSNTILTGINQLPPSGGQTTTLKSSLKKNSSYAANNSASNNPNPNNGPTPDELKV